MKSVLRLLASELVLGLAVAGCGVTPEKLVQGGDSPCEGKDATRYMAGGKECLVFKAFGVETAGDSPTLIVFLHGDNTRGGATDYMYSVAARYAEPGVIAVAILRPGHYDSDGNASTEGEQWGSWDNYTPHNIESVALVVGGLKERHKAKKVILIGHSGGAAYVGVMLGKYPNLANSAILVACPCNIDDWRWEKGRLRWTWSLSPHSFVGGIARDTRVIAVSGELDSVVSPGIQKEYIKTLTERGTRAEYREIPGVGHGFYSIGNSSTFSSAVESLINE